MPRMTEAFVVLERQDAESETAFGLAVARELRRLHPYNTSGCVAQRVRCTKRAAENILDGHLSARSITRLTRAYGWSLLIQVGAVVTGETLETFIRNRAAEARREAEQWLALDQQELPRARQPPPSDQDRLAVSKSWSGRDA